MIRFGVIGTNKITEEFIKAAHETDEFELTAVYSRTKEMDAVITYSKITDSHLPSEIQGEQGTILINIINHLDQVEIRRKAFPIENITRPQSSSPMVYEVQEFIDLLNKNKLESPTNSHKNSLIY